MPTLKSRFFKIFTATILLVGLFLSFTQHSFAAVPTDPGSAESGTPAGSVPAGPQNFTNSGGKGPDLKDLTQEGKGIFAHIGGNFDSSAAAGSTAGGECLDTGNCSVCDMLQVVVNIGNLILATFGAFALIMFLWGGFGMITARGDSEKIDGAKAVLWNALAGSVMILLAWQIVAIIIFVFTGKANPFDGICGT